jgi:hypothetical protein
LQNKHSLLCLLNESFLKFMALLYKKRIEGNAVTYDFTVKTRWIVLLAIPVGFVLFVSSIKPNSPSLNTIPVFLISIPILLGGLGFAVIENMLYVVARTKSAKATIIKRGVIKLEGKQMAQSQS